MRYLLLLVLFLNFSAVLCAQKRLKDTLILPFEYDKIEREKEHGYVLTKKSKKYLFNSKNFEIGQFKSEENKKGEIKVVDVVFDYKVVKDTSGYFTIDRNNTRLVPESFDDYSIQSNNQIIFRKGELYGLISVSGHLIITADVEELEYLGGLYYFKKNGVKGFLNVNGEVTFYGFDRYKVLGNGTYSVSKKTKYALVGPDGKIKTPYRYSKIGAFAYNGGSYPYINVAKTGKEYVFLDREGNTLSKPFYSMVPPRNYTLDKWIKVREVSGFCNLIKLNGERFFATDSTTYDDVQMLRNNRVCVRVKPKDERRFYFGIVNREGEFVVPPIYFYVGEFHNNIAPAIKLSETGEKSISGYLKEDGTFFEIPSNKLEEFSNGYGIFHDYGSPDSPGKSAVVDTNFNFIISPEQGYDLIIGPQDSMFILLKDSFYGYADLNGKEIIPCRYKQAEPFENGLAKVDNGRVYLNKKGEEVLNLEKGDELVDFSEDIGLRLKKIKKDGFWGVIDFSGSIWIEPKYDSLKIDNYIFRVWKDGVVGLLDIDGKELLKPKYKSIKINDNSSIGQWWIIAQVKNEKYGLKILGGDWLLKPEYESIQMINSSFQMIYENGIKTGLWEATYLAKKDGKYGLVKYSVDEF